MTPVALPPRVAYVRGPTAGAFFSVRYTISPDMAHPPTTAVVASDLQADRAYALGLTPVSRETVARLDRFVDLLLEWEQKLNLIGRSTIPELWTRHIADSLQLLALAPKARVWIDLGSGAGFPGLVLACALAGEPGACVHLIESKRKKADFLREAARQIGLPAVVHEMRIEDFTATFKDKADAVTARALAPLTPLLELAAPLLKTGAQGLFPKGQDVEAELTEAAKCWTINATLVQSKTSPQGCIVVVHSVARRHK
jgi:16S rRNA (guanine527-N7)-methyltransferase